MSPSLLSSPPPFPAPVQNLASVCRERKGGRGGDLFAHGAES